jgi:hypothetical protein
MNRLISFKIIIHASLLLLLLPISCFSNAIDIHTDQVHQHDEQQFHDIPSMLNSNNEVIHGSMDDTEPKNIHHTPSRRTTENSDTCSPSVCNNNDSFSNILAPTTSSSSVDGKDNANNGLFSNLMNRLTGFLSNHNNLFSRLMNGLLNVFQPNSNAREDTKYMIPTGTIVPLLSKYNDKINNLTNLINNEMETNTDATTSNAINMIYTFSITNLNAITTILDPILIEFKQHETMDVQTISCYLLQFVTFIHATTVPNIVSMSQILYTKTNSENMHSMWNQYSSSSTSSSTKTTTATSTTMDGTKTNSTTATSNQLRSTPNKNSNSQNQCTDVTTSVTRQVVTERQAILNDLFGANSSVGPIGHIIRIVALIVLFPLSILVSLLGTIVLIIYLLLTTILNEPVTTDDGNEVPVFILIVVFGITIGAPIIVIFAIFQNILGIFQDLLDPFIPDPPTPAPTMAPMFQFKNPPTSTIPTQNKSSSSSSSSSSQEVVSDVKYQLSLVLFASPIQSILNILQDATTYMNQNDEANDEMDCDVMIVSCKTDVLLNTLPL